MGINYQHIRLANFGRDDLKEIDADALVDAGASELCISQHIANQLRLKQLEEREVRIAMVTVCSCLVSAACALAGRR
jgi:predicted aspartyl protease